MTSFAPLPEPHEVPPGMVHVGWRCTAPGHDCLMSLSRDSGRSAYPDEAYLSDANHHAGWTPVYANLDAPTGDPPVVYVVGTPYADDEIYGVRLTRDEAYQLAEVSGKNSNLSVEVIAYEAQEEP